MKTSGIYEKGVPRDGYDASYYDTQSRPQKTGAAIVNLSEADWGPAEHIEPVADKVEV